MQLKMDPSADQLASAVSSATPTLVMSGSAPESPTTITMNVAASGDNVQNNVAQTGVSVSGTVGAGANITAQMNETNGTTLPTVNSGSNSGSSANTSENNRTNGALKTVTPTITATSATAFVAQQNFVHSQAGATSASAAVTTAQQQQTSSSQSQVNPNQFTTTATSSSITASTSTTSNQQRFIQSNVASPTAAIPLR